MITKIILANPKAAYNFRISGKFSGYIADGMTIDRSGFLWFGMFKGSNIVQINPAFDIRLKNYNLMNI